MKRFWNHFAPLIVIDIIAIIAIIVSAVAQNNIPKVERGNYDCPAERVLDFADVLTEEEELRLTSLILEKQEECQCDIVILTLNVPFQSFSPNVDIGEIYSEYAYYNMAMNYADEVYDTCAYGYNRQWGDGCIFVDNFARENDGWRYGWLSTSGRCEDRYSSSDIDELLDDVYEIWDESDPYKAYERLVNKVARHMRPTAKATSNNVLVFGFITAIIATISYMCSNLKKRVGVDTTTVSTYVGKNYRCVQSDDKLISQDVTKIKIESSSSSGGGGGGGHHISSGGHSHGGGGHRH